MSFITTFMCNNQSQILTSRLMTTFLSIELIYNVIIDSKYRTNRNTKYEINEKRKRHGVGRRVETVQEKHRDANLE